MSAIEHLPSGTKLYRKDGSYYLIQGKLPNYGRAFLYQVIVMDPSGIQTSQTGFCLKECVPREYSCYRDSSGIIWADPSDAQAEEYLWSRRYRFLTLEVKIAQKIANCVLAEVPERDADIVAIEMPGQGRQNASFRMFQDTSVPDLCFQCMRDLSKRGPSLEQKTEELEREDNDQNTGRMTVSHAAVLFWKVCEMMRQIHMAGYVIGDLTPSNIMIFQGEGTALSNIVLCPIDFECSRPLLKGCNRTEAVRIDEIGFTAGFSFAPEFAEGGGNGLTFLSVQSDQYAAGSILYRFLKGKEYYGKFVTDVMQKIQTGKTIISIFPMYPLPAVELKERGVNPDTQIVLRRIKNTCLDENPDKRYMDRGGKTGDDYLLDDAAELVRLVNKPKKHEVLSKPVMDPKDSPTLKKFTGRKKELKELDRKIKSGKINPVFVTGPGGIGKSTLVQKYAADHSEYIYAYMVYETNLMDAVVNLNFSGENMSEKGKNAYLDIYYRHLEWLGNYGKYMCLIIDNFDARGYDKSFEELLDTECFPSTDVRTNRDVLRHLRDKGIYLLFTTRTTGSTDNDNFFELSSMDEDTLLMMAKNIIGDAAVVWDKQREKEMREMIRLVGFHTMTVSMIAVSVRERADFWSDPVRQLKELIAREGYSDSPNIINERDYEENSIDGHLRAVFYFNEFSGKEKELLPIFSFIPVAGCPLELFEKLIGTGIENQLDRFRKLHVISVEKKRIFVHPLVSHYLAEGLRVDESLCKSFINAVKDYSKSSISLTDVKDFVELEVTVTKRISNTKNLPDQMKSLSIQLLRDASSLYYERLYQPRKMIECIQKICDLYGSSYLTDDEAAAFKNDYFGTIITSVFDHRDTEEALSYHLKALNIKQHFYPEENEAIAISYDNISNDYAWLDNIDKALRYRLAAQKIRENLYPKNTYSMTHIWWRSYDHILESDSLYFTDDIKNYYIDIYDIDINEVPLKEFDMSLQIWKKEAAIQKELYSNPLYDGNGRCFWSHEELEFHFPWNFWEYEDRQRDIAGCYILIGRIYSDLKRYKDALLFQLHALYIYHSLFPDGEQDMTFIYNDIGTSFYKLAHYKEALLYLKKALRLEKISIFEPVDEIITSYKNIGTVYSRLNQFDNSQKSYGKAIDLMEKIHNTKG